MKPYPVDLRERLLQAEDAGLVRAEIARCFGISPRSLSRWRRLHREQGSPAPRPRPGRAPLLPPERWSALRAQVAAHPDATLAEHCARWAAEQGARVSEATMSRLLARVGAATQKQTLIARERDEAERAAFRAGAAALAPADLVFLDETDTPTTLTPLRARAPRGGRPWAGCRGGGASRWRSSPP